MALPAMPMKPARPEHRAGKPAWLRARAPGGAAFDFRRTPQAARLAEAQGLMRQAGYGPGNRLALTYATTTSPDNRRLAAVLQAMLSQVYVRLTIRTADVPNHFRELRARDYDLGLANWYADFNDASNFLDLYRTGGGNNWGEYSNPAFDAMMDAAQRDTDLVSRGRKLAQAESIMLKDFAAAPLFYWVSLNMTWPYVKGFQANAQDYHRSRWVTIDEAARARQFA